MTIVITLFPLLANAATVGFVPSTGIWFSKTSFTPKETILVYTVVVNNEYYSLDGVVSFYDNNEVFDVVKVKGLAKESAVQIKAAWTPDEGTHALSARLIKAVATDPAGNKQNIVIDQINSFTGSALTINNLVVPPSPNAQTTAPSTEAAGLGLTSVAVSNSGNTAVASVPSPVEIEVNKQNDQFILTAPTKKTLVNKSSIPSLDAAAKAAEEFFAKNREALAKAQKTINTITTTVGVLESAYGQTKSAIEKGQAMVAEGQEQAAKAKPYIEKFKAILKKVEPWWNRISNHNNPKRVMIIVGGVVVVWLLWRLSRLRTRQFYDR